MAFLVTSPINMITPIIEKMFSVCPAIASPPTAPTSDSGSDNMITLAFPAEWMESHPLTLFDLQQEARDLRAIGLNFRVNRPAPQ